MQPQPLLSVIPRIQHVAYRVLQESTTTKFFALLVAFIAPLYTMVAVVLFFVTLDTLSAIYSAYQEKKRRYRKLQKLGMDPPKHSKFKLLRKAYSPEKMGLTITKVVSYPVILLAFYIFDIMVLGIKIPEEQWFLNFSFTNYMFVLLSAVDLFSFISNMGAATGHWSWRAASRILSRQFRRESKQNDSQDFDFTDPARDADYSEET